MDFSTVQPDDCMGDLTMTVANEMREHLLDMYRGMYQRGEDLEAVIPNVVLAGFTIVWLEAVHAVFGTADYESAIRLASSLRPDDKEVYGDMKLAARDFLRRARWIPRRRQK